MSLKRFFWQRCVTCCEIGNLDSDEYINISDMVVNIARFFCNYNVALLICHLNLWPIGELVKSNGYPNRGGGAPAIRGFWMKGGGGQVFSNFVWTS